ncbi:MAG TPA: VIT1/CCC1 transporter family protein [Candidatus Saccharimonadales bacterium]
MPILRRIHLPLSRQYFTAMLAGWEGGLSTTTAIIAGLMISTDKPDLVVLIAIISFMVQAFNGAVGRFSAEQTEQELDSRRRWMSYADPAKDAIVQFLAHVTVSILVILPIVMIANVLIAVSLSICITLLFLFFIGFYKGRLAKTSGLRDGVELVVLGSLIISIGITAGYFLQA